MQVSTHYNVILPVQQSHQVTSEDNWNSIFSIMIQYWLFYDGIKKQELLIMKASLDCLHCVLAQAVRAARIATPDPSIQREIINAVSERIPTLDLENSPAVISQYVYEYTAAISGNADPYAFLKKEQNIQALALEHQLHELVKTSSNPLITALHLSAAGNIIDLGALHNHKIDVESAIQQVLHESFAVDHTEIFLKSLRKCQHLLFFLDNAGEIVFDKILIQELQQHTEVTAVVKKEPIINDATMADAEQVGLTECCEVIDNGGAFIGSPLDQIPERLWERINLADVLIGKGQGNYETMDEIDADMFLILRAKCEIVAADMGVNLGQMGMISTRIKKQYLSEQGTIFPEKPS